MKRLTFLPSFETDLLNSWLYIAQDNPQAADQFIDTVRYRCLQLEEFPLSGIASDDIIRGARRLVFGNYMIIYFVRDETLEIVRLLHGKRNLADD